MQTIRRNTSSCNRKITDGRLFLDGDYVHRAIVIFRNYETGCIMVYPDNDGDLPESRIEGDFPGIEERIIDGNIRRCRIGSKGRLSIPSDFMDLLPGGEALIIDFGHCIEIWDTERWKQYCREKMQSAGGSQRS